MVIEPQSGPQIKAAKSKAFITVYGGAAGGGKSWIQAYLACQDYRNPGSRAGLCRRTYQMLRGSGSLWDECKNLYTYIGGRSTESPMEWNFDTGARVELFHLQHEKDAAKNHKSKQYTRLGADEASDLTGAQAEFMVSRLRSVSGLRTSALFTTNPDPDCYLRDWISWWIGSDGYPIPERDGVVRYYVRVKDERLWANTPEELARYVGGDVRHVKSLTFIAAKLTDNKILCEADPDYYGNLLQLPEVERARYLGGNWDAREAAGDYFQQGWCPEYGGTELERVIMGQTGPDWDIVQVIRFWDRAAIPIMGDLVPGIKRPSDFRARPRGAENPDWSVGVKVGRFRNGKRVILDAVGYRDTPGAILEAMKRHAIEDGPHCIVGYCIDPAQAGIDQAERTENELRAYARCYYYHQAKTKAEYARDPSRAMWRGEIMRLRGAYERPFWNQLEVFPTKDKKDDFVDGLTGCEQYYAENPMPAYDGYEGMNSGHTAIVAPTAAQVQMFARGMDDEDTTEAGSCLHRHL
jgi:hypothetical protein